MTPDNYSLFMQTLAKKAKNGSGILSKNYKNLPQYQDLYNLVVIKNLISEYIWYVLAGCLVISISSHSIANIKPSLYSVTN